MVVNPTKELTEYLDQHVVEVVYPPGFESNNRIFILAYNECFPDVSKNWLETYIRATYLPEKYSLVRNKIDAFYGTMTATEVVTWFKVH